MLDLPQYILDQWLLISFGVFLLWYVVYTIQFRREIKRWKMPGPDPILPIFGQLFLMIKFILYEYELGYKDLNNKFDLYGKTYVALPLGRPPMVFTCDPRLVEHMLKTNFDNYIKGTFLTDILEPIFGDGIFNTNGVTWKSQRQVASHLFKLQEMRHYVNIFIEHGGKLLEKLERQAPRNGPVEMQDLFSRFTLDSIGEIAFGFSINSLEDNDVPFAKAFNTAQIAIAERSRNLWMSLAGPLKPLFKSEQVLKKAMKVIDEFAYQLIETRKKEANVEEREDLLSRYICMKDQEGKPFSDKYLRDVILNFMLAGRDTTAATLTFCCYLLSKNPRVEAKMLEEIENTLHGANPDYDTVKNMPYLQAVIEETLRIFPPVPVDPKQAVEEDVLPNGMVMPKNGSLSWCAIGMGVMPDVFDNPSEFRPERWLGENGGKPLTDPYLHIPFQAGPRKCLGMKMAYLEAKVMLILLYRKFTFKPAENFNVKLQVGITLLADGGVLVIPQKRVPSV